MSEQRIENKAEEAERIDLIRFLGDFFRVFRRTWIWVLILTVAGGGFFLFSGLPELVPGLHSLRHLYGPPEQRRRDLRYKYLL